MPLVKPLAVGTLLALAAPAWALPLWQEGANKPRERADTLPDFTKLAREATPAVVSISTTQSEESSEDPIKSLLDSGNAEPQKGLGSGFFIHPDGYLVTNAHVVEGATDIVITTLQDGRTRDYPAQIVGIDTPTDAALLKVDGDGGFPVLQLGDSDTLDVAEWIAAIGNPYGLSHSITVGIVSYKGRNDVMPAGREGYYDYIQTDASINPGNSGGPVLNTSGEVVAVANAVNAVGQGIGFAIPINMFKAVLVPLLKRGAVQRSWLGITVQDLSPDILRSANLQGDARGVLVTEVAEGSPGNAAGIKSGDLVVSFNGERIDVAQKLRWLAATSGIGREVALVVHRKGHAEQLVATLAALPAAEPQAIPQPVDVGIVVGEVDVPTARSQGLALPMGARVQEVRPGSAAQRAGVQAGDVILKVDTLPIHSPVGVSRAMSKLQSGATANLVLRRKANTLFVALHKP